MFRFLRPKAEPEPAAVAIPAIELEAIVGGGLALLRELPGICEHAKKRLRQSDRPIMQGVLEELLRMLAHAKERSDAEMRRSGAGPGNLTIRRLRLSGTKQHLKALKRGQPMPPISLAASMHTTIYSFDDQGFRIIFTMGQQRIAAGLADGGRSRRHD
jgi:hypothetical protein